MRERERPKALSPTLTVALSLSIHLALSLSLSLLLGKLTSFDCISKASLSAQIIAYLHCVCVRLPPCVCVCVYVSVRGCVHICVYVLVSVFDFFVSELELLLAALIALRLQHSAAV